MQDIKYFSAAMNDIKHSPGWFGKACLLGLIAFIPIFGIIVLLGYLYGWAREMAWGVHEPLPARIFGNTDGKLYRRGFYLLVLNIVLAIIVNVIISALATIPGMSVTSTTAISGYSFSTQNYTLPLYLIYLVLAIIQSFIMWIGYMRISIYDRLSAGFQIGKIWKMYKHDQAGIWRILGMQLLVGIIGFFILSIVFSILLAAVLVPVIGAAGMTALGSGSASAVAALLISAGPTVLLITLVGIYAIVVFSVFLEMLLARALGYWTMQFDVPHWRSQDDPMPFELLSLKEALRLTQAPCDPPCRSW